MGKVFDPPISEELGVTSTTVAPEVTKDKTTDSATASGVRDTAVTALGRSTIKPSASLVDTYKAEIDLYDDFVLDKHPASDKREKQKAMAGFIRLFQNIVKLEPAKAYECLDYFLTNVGKNNKVYASGEISTPIFTMTKKEIPYDCKTERFMDLIIFLVDLQTSIGKGEVGKFVGRYRDLPYFFREWPVPQRDTLVNYVVGKVN